MHQRIVHLATTHRPGDPRIFQKECRTLAAAGYEVVYIVPGDKDEVVDGVQIRTVPVPRSGKERMTSTVHAVYKKALEEGPEAVMHFHDSDFLLAGFWLKRSGWCVVYDSHEDTPKQMQYQHWIPKILRPVASAYFAALEHRAGQRFDGIIAAEPSNSLRYPRSKTVIVRNYPLLDELVVSDALPYRERPNRIVYVGSLTRVRGIDEMIRAVNGLPEAYGAELSLGGSFHPATLQHQVLNGARSVRFLGYLGRSAVAELLARSRVGVVVMHPVQKHIEVLSTKKFEYMAAGLPVVVSDFPVWREIVHDAECGFVVNPLDADALRDKIRWLLDHPEEAEAMGQRGRAAVEAKYNWTPEGHRLLAFYERLLTGQSPGEPS